MPGGTIKDRAGLGQFGESKHGSPAYRVHWTGLESSIPPPPVQPCIPRIRWTACQSGRPCVQSGPYDRNDLLLGTDTPCCSAPIGPSTASQSRHGLPCPMRRDTEAGRGPGERYDLGVRRRATPHPTRPAHTSVPPANFPTANVCEIAIRVESSLL